jgi:hypothetical protein
LGQVRASTTFTEPSTGESLTDEGMSQLLDNAALRAAIKDYFRCFASALKVRGVLRAGTTGPASEERKPERRGSCSDADPFSPPSSQESQFATVEVTFGSFTEHVAITMTWGEYLDQRGVSRHNQHLFYDVATGRDLTRGATLEDMGYRGGKLAVRRR